MAAPVVAETAWIIESRLGPTAESRFVRWVATGELEVADLVLEDYRRCAELIDTYSDMGLGLVDASVVTIAERLGANTIAALNHGDFTVIRPQPHRCVPAAPISRLVPPPLSGRHRDQVGLTAPQHPTAARAKAYRSFRARPLGENPMRSLAVKSVRPHQNAPA